MFNSLAKDWIDHFILDLLKKGLTQAGPPIGEARAATFGGYGVDAKLLMGAGFLESNLFLIERDTRRHTRLITDFPLASHCGGDLGHFRQMFEQMYGLDAGINLLKLDFSGTIEPSAAEVRNALPILRRGTGPRFLVLVMADSRRSLALEDPAGVAHRAMACFGRDAALGERLEAFWGALWARYQTDNGQEGSADPFKVALRELSALTCVTEALLDDEAQLTLSEAFSWVYVGEHGFRMRAFLFLVADEPDPSQALDHVLTALHAAPCWFVRGDEAFRYDAPLTVLPPPRRLQDLADEEKELPSMKSLVVDPSALSALVPAAAAQVPADHERQEHVDRLEALGRNELLSPDFRESIQYALAHLRVDPSLAMTALLRTVLIDLLTTVGKDPTSYVDAAWPGLANLLRPAAAPVMPPPAPSAVVLAPRSANHPPKKASTKQKPREGVPQEQEGEEFFEVRLTLVRAKRGDPDGYKDAMLAAARLLRFVSQDHAGPLPTEAKGRLQAIIATVSGKRRPLFFVRYLGVAKTSEDFQMNLTCLADAYDLSAADVLAEAQTSDKWRNPPFPIDVPTV